MAKSKDKARKAKAKAKARRAIERFHRLCRDGDFEGVRDALQAGVDVNSETEFGERGLMAAVIKGHSAVVGLLLEQEGIEVDIVGGFGDSEFSGIPLLIVAVQCPCAKHVDCVKLLLSDARVDPNIKDPEMSNISPLMFAVKYNRVDCVKLLLADTRVDLMTRDEYERSEDEAARSQLLIFSGKTNLKTHMSHFVNLIAIS